MYGIENINSNIKLFQCCNFVNKYNILPYITHLRICDNTLFHLPRSLKYLQLYKYCKSQIDINILPQSLETIEFASDYPFNLTHLPSHIKIIKNCDNIYTPIFDFPEPKEIIDFFS